MQSFLKAFFFVFISEMGDKTQVVSLVFGTQYPFWVVMSGTLLGVALMMTATTAIGSVAGGLLPVFWMNIAAGILFILFGLSALRHHQESDQKTVGARFGPLIAVTATFVVAELGDKTALPSMVVAGQQHEFLPVWAGSVL